jgi:DNA-binding CsgD family transcriptional regulator
MRRSGGFDVPGVDVPGGVAVPVPVCVGREGEVGRLVSLARGVAAGRGAVVWVEGEPGIGKTTLLGVVAAECARLGVRVLRGGAEELEQRLPFAAVGAALGVRPGGAASADDRGVARLAGLLLGDRAFGSSASAANHELVVTEAVLELVDHWCAAGPVALVVDDVQWADAASVVVLHRLGQAVERERLPLLLVVAARPVPRGEEVAGLIRSLAAHGGQPLAVGPLSGPAVAELVGRLLGSRPGPQLLGLVAGAGGNPMYVAEVVAALSREGLVCRGGGVAEAAAVADPAGSRGRRRRGSIAVPPPAARRTMIAPPSVSGVAAPPEAEVSSSEWVPRSLVEAVQRRLGFLSAGVREMLEMAAALGSTVDVAELSMVLDLPVGVLSGVVAEAMAAGLLADSGQVLVFRHDVIRQALACHQPAPVRTALRLRAGQVLAAAGAPVERVAGHLLAGGMLEPSMVEWLVRSAEALTVRAPELAVRLLRRASASAEDGLAGVLCFHLVRAQLWAGELVEAEHTARAALAAGPAPGREGALRWLLAQARFRQGRLGDAVTTAEDALASGNVTPAEVGRFHGFVALCVYLLEQFDKVDAVAGKALAAADASGDTVAEVYAYTTVALRHLARGELVESLRFSERALAACEAGDRTDVGVDPYLTPSYCLMALDRIGEADEALVRSLRRNQQSGGMVYLPMSYCHRARLRFLDGRWDDALAEVQAGLDVPDPYHLAAMLPSLAALVAVHRGTRPSGGEAGEAGDAEGAPGRKSLAHLVLWPAALAEEARGNPRRALDLLFPAWEKPPGRAPRRVIYEICPDLARWAAATGDTGRAGYLAATTEALAAQLPSPSMDATALLCRGVADGEPGLLLEAARCFQQAGRPLCEGYGYEEAAVLLAGRGETAEARAALDRALALYADLDAVWDTARAQARLRQAGIRRGRGKALRRRPAHGWEALTETERKVALLVAEGLSNPDIATKMFLSRRTVQSHVSSILAKLEVTSRVEVAVRAQRHTTT